MERATFKAVCEFFGSQKKTASALGVTPGAVNHVARGPAVVVPIYRKAYRWSLFARSTSPRHTLERF